MSKRGEYSGARSQGVNVAAILQAANEQAQQALEINDDLIRFIQENCGNNQANKGDEWPEGISQEDCEALKEIEKAENGPKNGIEGAKIEGNHEQTPTSIIGLNPENNNMINPSLMPTMDPS